MNAPEIIRAFVEYRRSGELVQPHPDWPWLIEVLPEALDRNKMTLEAYALMVVGSELEKLGVELGDIDIAVKDSNPYPEQVH